MLTLLSYLPFLLALLLVPVALLRSLAEVDRRANGLA
jgi:hypothetical protein